MVRSSSRSLTLNTVSTRPASSFAFRPACAAASNSRLPEPNADTLAMPRKYRRKMRCSPTVNVDRLKPFSARAGTPPAPGPVFDAGQEGEHEVELLLKCRVVRGVTRYLVRWRGHPSADDEWLRLEELVAEYNAAAAPPSGLGPTPHPRLLQPLRRPRRHRVWYPPGFGSRFRPRS